MLNTYSSLKYVDNYYFYFVIVNETTKFIGKYYIVYTIQWLMNFKNVFLMKNIYHKYITGNFFFNHLNDKIVYYA